MSAERTQREDNNADHDQEQSLVVHGSIAGGELDSLIEVGVSIARDQWRRDGLLLLIENGQSHLILFRLQSQERAELVDNTELGLGRDGRVNKRVRKVLHETRVKIVLVQRAHNTPNMNSLIKTIDKCHLGFSLLAQSESILVFVAESGIYGNSGKRWWNIVERVSLGKFVINSLRLDMFVGIVVYFGENFFQYVISVLNFDIIS
mmetsp:Transcript_19882/g.28960  ORF Transcript_19882/g.28960 Transcript_19882/m.28960 type:complete len:205 (-) Transcript_19882:592-1206(-)